MEIITNHDEQVNFIALAVSSDQHDLSSPARHSRLLHPDLRDYSSSGIEASIKLLVSYHGGSRALIPIELIQPAEVPQESSDKDPIVGHY